MRIGASVPGALELARAVDSFGFRVQGFRYRQPLNPKLFRGQGLAGSGASGVEKG